MRVIWSARAVREADDIAAYIAKDRPMAAESWLIGAFESAEQLKEFRSRAVWFRAAGEVIIASSSIERLTASYRIEGSLVRIVAVRNFAQRLDLRELGIE